MKLQVLNIKFATRRWSNENGFFESICNIRIYEIINFYYQNCNFSLPKCSMIRIIITSSMAYQCHEMVILPRILNENMQFNISKLSFVFKNKVILILNSFYLFNGIIIIFQLKFIYHSDKSFKIENSKLKVSLLIQRITKTPFPHLPSLLRARNSLLAFTPYLGPQPTIPQVSM